MTKKINELTLKAQNLEGLTQWPEKGRKSHADKVTANSGGMNTQFRVQAWFKPKGENKRDTWFTNGLYLLEEFERNFRYTPQGGEIEVIARKIRSWFGKIDRVVIYDKRPNRKREIIFEWYHGTGITHNDLKNINWTNILEQ